MDDPDNYDDLVREVANSGAASAVANIGEDPERGARALQLAQSTGVQPYLIYNDPDFDTNNRAQSAAHIVYNNPQLNAYVQSDPLAPIVSNDDYGNLAQFSESTQQSNRLFNVFSIGLKAQADSLARGLEGVQEGWGGPLSSTIGYAPIDELMATPGSASGALYRMMFIAGQVGLKSISALAKGTMAAAAGYSESLYENTIGDVLPASIDPYGSKGFGKAVGGMVELAFNQPPIAMGISPRGVRDFAVGREMKVLENSPIEQAAARANPWVRDGIEPPRGVDPIIDKLKADANVEALGSLENDLAIAVQSLTRERSPEMFKKFAEQHYGNSTIGISGDRVVELYRDRVPSRDDGLLGWVDDIEGRLEAARLTGDDIRIPVSDWVSYVDPAIAKALSEDIRMWPGGVTAREATLAELPRTVVDSPLAEVRNAATLEPMYAYGDRKLELRKSENRFSDFQDELIIHNDQGSPIGYVIIEPRPNQKTLYIDMIQAGIEGVDVNSLGPSAIRDIKRQLKEMYPEYEYVTGHRVSGARDRAGSWDQPSAHPQVKLSLNEIEGLAEYDSLRGILSDAWKKQFHPEIDAYVKPTELYTKYESELSNLVKSEVDRLTGGRVETVTAQKIAHADSRKQPGGVFLQYKDRLPKILVDLFSRTGDPVGVARHESIHFLRQYGFYTAKEWEILSKAAKDEGWASRYGIDQRYKGSEALKLEESIAEAFRDWARNRDANVGVKTPVTAIFEKMAALWDGIRAKFRELTGREPTWEELFEQTFKGEVGSRTDFTPLNEAAFKPKLSLEDAGKVAQDQFDKLRADAAGLDLKSYKQIQDKIRQRYVEDLEAATKRAEAIERKTLTKEWRENLANTRVEVEATMKQRPDIAADLFLGSGEIFGNKLRQRYSLHADDLTPEQIAALPKQYVSKSGLPADDTAQLFGFVNKDALVEALVEYNAGKKGKSSQEYLREQVNQEAARIMQQRYGNLDDNVMTAAKDRAFSDTNLDLIAEELQGAAMKSGIQVIDKKLAQSEMSRIFSGMKIAEIDSNKLMALVGKHGRDAERALIAGDDASALVSLQKKYMTALLTRMALDLEKSKVTLDKVIRPYQGREIKGPAPEYVPYIQDLLMQAGYKMRQTPEQIARGIEFHGEGSLEKFIDRVRGDGFDAVVSESIIRNGVKPLDNMTAAEFGEFSDAIRSLNHIGRRQNRIEIAGAAEEFAAYRKKVLENIAQLPARTRAEQNDGKGRWMYKFDAWVTRGEEVIKDLDLRKELGPLWEGVIQNMESSKASFNQMAEELATYFRSVEGEFGRKWRKTLDDTIPQDIIYDPFNKSMYDMTRENLIQIMLNWGTRSNIEKYTRGAFVARFGRRPNLEELGIFEGMIKNMIDTHATKEDWKFVEAMWKPFKKWQPMMDTVARNTTGVPPKLIPAEKVMTKFGELEGGYWPVKYDQLGSNIAAIKDRASASKFFDGTYFRAATAKSYLKDRTGYVDFVDISRSLEQAAGTMQQTMHDIAYREAIMQASKILFDPAIKQAITRHYGVEYAKQMEPWLKRISYQYAVDDEAASAINGFLRRMRINLVGHTLPFNYKVILSPDVGVPNPVTWSRFMSNYKENMQFVMENSKEVKHLVYNLDRDYSEAMSKIVNDSRFDSVRRKAVEWGYAIPVKMSQQFRAATFWNEYNKAMGRGLTKEQAIKAADSYVREQHGTASIADSSAMMNPNSEALKMLTVFQGYFNMQYNWQRQIPGQLRRGEYRRAFEAFAGTYGVNIALGALLFNQAKENDSWFKIIGKSILMAPFQLVPIGNSAASYFGEGFNPRVPFAGLLTAIEQSKNDLAKAYKNKKVEKPITHAANVVGLSTGLPLGQIGKTAQFTYDVNTGRQRPRNIIEYMRGYTSGEARLKK